MYLGTMRNPHDPLAPCSPRFGVCDCCGEGIYAGEEYAERDGLRHHQGCLRDKLLSMPAGELFTELGFFVGMAPEEGYI